MKIAIITDESDSESAVKCIRTCAPHADIGVFPNEEKAAIFLDLDIWMRRASAIIAVWAMVLFSTVTLAYAMVDNYRIVTLGKDYVAIPLVTQVLGVAAVAVFAILQVLPQVMKAVSRYVKGS